MAGRSSTGLIRGDVMSGQRNASRKYIVGCACAAIGPTGGVGQVVVDALDAVDSVDAADALDAEDAVSSGAYAFPRCPIPASAVLRPRDRRSAARRGWESLPAGSPWIFASHSAGTAAAPR